jgi:hypothetical protein
MTEAANPNQVYKPNAGLCEKCGNAKTWDFKILNPTSGKHMPAHLDAQGHVLGDGNCPFWAGVAKKNAAKKEAKKNSAVNSAFAAPTHAAVAVRTALDDDIDRADRQRAAASDARAIPQPYPEPAPQLGVEAIAENNHITIYVGEAAFTIPRDKADILARKLVKILF